MLRLVSAAAVVCLGAVVVGAVVPGMFWLTIVALAGLLGSGAVGLSLLGPLDPDEDMSVVSPRVDVTPPSVRRRVRDGGRISRAA